MDVDTSTYPRAAPPQQQNPLDQVGKLQEMGLRQQQSQKNAIGIDQEKLKLVNQKWDYGSKVLGSLLNKPDLKGEDLIDAYQELVKNGVKTPDQAAKSMTEIPTLAEVKRNNPNATPEQAQALHSQKLKDMTSYQLMKGASIIEQLNHAYGSNPSMMQGGDYQQPQNVYRGALQPTGQPIPNRLGVETPGYVPPSTDAQGNAIPGRMAPIGSPSFPPGPVGRSSGYPGQNSTAAPPLPVANPNTPIQPKKVQTVPAPALPANLGPSRPVPGTPPFGEKEAAEETGGQSGKLLAQHRAEASNYQRTVFPLEKSIDTLDKLGTKGTGPGTDTWNNMKSFILSNVPGVTEKTFDNTVKDYDEAKKYLTDFVNQNGNTGTNDKLAAAFAGNPSVHISNAAASDVAKSAMALARMKQAQVIAFGRTGLPDRAYAKWAADNSAQWDARAFGVDKMTKDAKAKLYKELDKDPREGALFDQSLEIAHNLGLVKLR